MSAMWCDMSRTVKEAEQRGKVVVVVAETKYELTARVARQYRVEVATG